MQAALEAHFPPPKTTQKQTNKQTNKQNKSNLNRERGSCTDDRCSIENFTHTHTCMNARHIRKHEWWVRANAKAKAVTQAASTNKQTHIHAAFSRCPLPLFFYLSLSVSVSLSLSFFLSLSRFPYLGIVERRG